MKIPFTFTEQMQLMKSRGLIITDEDECLEFLRSVNYYWSSAYLLPFKQKDDSYTPGTTFKKFYRIYKFDRKLRSLIFSVIEEIELHLRAQFAYHSAHAHGATAYLCNEHYNSRHDHDKFLKVINVAISNNKNTSVVLHHNSVYGGVFPIWVIIDFFSIGNLSHFYADWLIPDKKQVARDLFSTTYPFVDSWMKCITVLRNRCAHYSRLYYSSFTDLPRIHSALQYECSGRVYDQLLMLKFLYIYKEKWNVVFVEPLKELVSEYKDSISFSHIGFPENWKDLLKYKKEP